MSAAKLIILFAVIIFAGCNLTDSNRAAQLNKTGLRYSAMGHKKAALRNFFNAARMKDIPDSNRSEYLANIGAEYWDDQPDSAIYYYTAAAKLNDSASYRWFLYKGCIQVVKNKIAKALPFLSEAYRLDSLGLLANSLLGAIYLGEYDTDYFDPRKALKHNQRSYHAYKSVTATFELAKNYYLVNQMHNSTALFEEVHNREPENTTYLQNLVMVYQEQGRPEADTLLLQLKDKDTAAYNRVIESDIQAGYHGLTWNH